jgi:superfamily II DNA or RNA helicase
MLTAESNWFKKRFLWRAVIVDEAHRLKNEKSQLAQKLKIVPAFSRVLLTGTPLQNNLREVSMTCTIPHWEYILSLMQCNVVMWYVLQRLTLCSLSCGAQAAGVTT